MLVFYCDFGLKQISRVNCAKITTCV